MNLVLREATSADTPAILELLELTAAKGSIELIYTRRPDAYASFRRESPETRVLVWTDNGNVAAVAALLTRDFYIEGAIRTGTYLTGLKKRPEVHERLDLAEPWRQILDSGVNLAFFSVLTSNAGVVRAFRPRTLTSPETWKMHPLGGLTTFFIKAGGRANNTGNFRQCQEADELALAEFYGRLAQKCEFFPTGIPWRFDDGLPLSEFHVVTDTDGRIVAAGALWDQTDYRQYIVAKYGPGWRLARLLNPVFSLMGYPQLPPSGTVISFPMACFLLSEPGYEDTLASGLTIAARQRGYDQLVAGLAHTSPFHTWFAKRRHISFESQLYQVLLADADDSIPFPSIEGIQCAFL